MRAVITGCAGFIGSHLVEALLADGHSVVGVDALTDNYPVPRKLENLAGPLSHPCFRFARADLASDPLPALLDRSDVVFHLAGEPGVRDSFGPGALRHARNNVVATRRLLAALPAGTRLVFASSSSVYGDAVTLPTPETVAPAPRSPYAETKLTAERLCLDAATRRGLDVVALRLFTVYGPRQRPDMAIARFIAAAVAGEPVAVHGDGLQSRDFTYVGDVVDAMRAAGTIPSAGGRVINVGGGAPVSVRHLVSAIEPVAGVAVRVRTGPPQRGDVAHTCADATFAGEVLGWTARTSLVDGLAAQWLCARDRSFAAA